MGLWPGKSWICEAVMAKEEAEDGLEHGKLIMLIVALLHSKKVEW